MPRTITILTVLIISFAAPLAALAGFHDTPHPFMIWTRDEAARIRQRVESEPWAKKEYARLLRDDSPLGKTFRELFRYVVMGDRKAGEAQRDYLLKIINTSPRQFENLDQDGRHFDCYLDALHYDAVHDLLTPSRRSRSRTRSACTSTTSSATGRSTHAPAGCPTCSGHGRWRPT